MSFSAVGQSVVKPIVQFVLNFQPQAAIDVNIQSQLINWRIGVQWKEDFCAVRSVSIFYTLF